MVNRRKRTLLPGGQSGYERVIGAIKHSLAEGRYDGGMLPPYRQLARELNVTMASVERAMAELEREGFIRRQNRRGVLPCARRHPVAPEKRLALQCINFVTPSFASLTSFVEADYLAGYTRALEQLAIRMRFVASEESDAKYNQLFSQVLPMEAQGVVLINSCAPELVERLRGHGMPFVVQYFTRYTTGDLPAHFGVYVNKPGGAFQAVNHLFELGHRSIGFMGMVDPAGVIDPGVPLEATVFEGYRSALVYAGLDCAESNLAHCDTREGRESFSIAKTFLDRSRRPTAVLAGCDEIARSLLNAAHALKLRVPEDLSIVGFDNQPESALADPPLTTVSVPRRELAQSAVELLLEAAEGPLVPPRTRILETHLIIRKTTAPPGRAAASGNTGG